MPEKFVFEVDIALGMTEHNCRKCGILLNENNSYKNRIKQSHYICRQCHNIEQAVSNNLIKKEVFSHYGSACACCKESNLAFLTIDHIDGNGAEHRRSIQKTSKLKSTDFYRWLKKNNYPTDNYQVLCFNCNCAKHICGICPHQKNNA